MKLVAIATLVILCGIFTPALSQSRKKKKASNGMPAAGYVQTPNSLNPSSPEQTRTGRSSRKQQGRQKITYDAQQEYYDRVVAVAKAREKAARIMEKPQYSDPMYFGHKRKPKKRPPKKMRLCKECGIRH